MQPNQPQNPPISMLGQARQQMNMGAPVMDQVSSQSPNWNPQLQMASAHPMPEKSPMSDFSKGLMTQGQNMGTQKPQQHPLEARKDLIVKALAKHLEQLDQMNNTQGVR